MNASRFDVIAKTATRRGTLRALAGGIAASLVPSVAAAQEVVEADAKGRRTGQACDGDDQCASGQCMRRRDDRRGDDGSRRECSCRRRGRTCVTNRACCSGLCIGGECFSIFG